MPEPIVDDKKTVEFTPEQQDHINKLINTRFAKVTEKHELEMKAMADEVQAQKDKAAAAAAAKPADDKGDKGGDAEENKRQMKALLDAEKLQTANMRNMLESEKAAKLKIQEENKAILKSQAIQDAVNSLPNGVEFHESKTVKKLTEDSVVFDADSNQWIIKENGVTKMNASMLPMTLSEFYAGFAASHPYLVKGVNKGGAGSAESGRAGASHGMTTIKTKADFGKDTKAKAKFISDFGYDAYANLPTK